MDWADEAERSEALFRAEALERAAARRARALRPTGRCFFCNEGVHADRLFCDLECRDDYEREQAARARAGRNN